MATTNLRKHTIPAESDTSISRATIFETFGNSIRDVIPVANVTERALVVSGLAGAGLAPSVSNPVVVYRADARGLHRVEWTTDGLVWVPASGVPSFASKADADAWGSANASLLTVGDRAMIAGVESTWLGSSWSFVTPVVTFGTGWATTGGLDQHVPRLVRQGYEVHLYGAVTSSAGFSYGNILTVQTQFRPSNGATRFVGTAVLSNGMVVEYALTNGQLSVPSGYASGTVPVGQAHPLHLSWLMD